MVWIMALGAVWLLACSPAAAHSPSKVSLSYLEQGQQLETTITHQTPDTQAHYIREVRLSVNGQVVNVSTHTRQPSPGTFTYTYPLSVKPGDMVLVTVSCSVGGSASESLTIPSKDTGGTAPRPTQAAAGILPAICMGLMVILRRAGR